MKNTIRFENLVAIAITEIRDAYENHIGWNWERDFLNDINYSEICEWCKFPDLGTNESIYEKAINTAIIVLSHNYTDSYSICEFMSKIARMYV